MLGRGASPFSVKICEDVDVGYFVYWQDAREQPPYSLHDGWHLAAYRLTRWGARWAAARVRRRLESPTVEYR